MEQSKKQCILEAAARAFARFGFKKTSVEEIAKDAGVAKGTVYLACDTKEDLFYQAVHREVRDWAAEIAKLIDPRQAADQLLVEIARAGLEYMHRRPLVRELLFGQHHIVLPEWSERLDELRALGRTNCTEVLRLGVKQGVFRADLDLDEVSRILQDFMIATHLFYDRGVDKDERLARRLATGFDMLMHGIRQGKPKHDDAPTEKHDDKHPGKQVRA
jgi:AcrR family transcriptional regulator